MRKSYLITPLNEGQELNYVEEFKFGRSGAISRAKYMAMRLAETLSHGRISVKVEDAKTGKLAFYGTARKTDRGFEVEDQTKDMK